MAKFPGGFVMNPQAVSYMEDEIDPSSLYPNIIPHFNASVVRELKDEDSKIEKIHAWK